ncbi:MAG TPA: hypothetical protein VM282_00140 [Acidimicrobiales bacterium]|nr:hypothetical protein [Acidimicrobiales bacterium]
MVATRVAGRMVRWQVSVAALGVFAFVMWQSETGPDIERTLISLCVAAALSPILADPAAVMLTSSPTSMRWRFALRVVWIAPAIICWIVAQWIFIAEPHRLSPPRWAWIELTTSLAVVLAAELTAARTTRATGLAGVAALVCFVATVAVLSRRIALLPSSEHELRFASLGAIAAALCHCASRDPALRLNRRERWLRQTEKESISEGTCNSAQVGSSRRWPQS